MLNLYNTLTRKIEEFKPLNPPKVGMYTCGPTVYDFPHIGNLRTFIMSDILQRTLGVNGYEVKRVMNITDIDDKIIKKAKEEAVGIEEITKLYEKAFFDDLEKLNIEPANVYPRATEHINMMIKYIEELIKRGLAYEKDGSVYFDIAKFPNYGKLSGLSGRTLKTGARVLSDEYEKENARDFALWKAVELSEVGYESPWGKGRPGWHIECSVMSQHFLGDTFDIHTGAVDLIFPHHENEIAQAEGKSGKRFANFFIHGEHLLVNKEKMAKSLKNFITLKEIEEKNFDPVAFRYLVLTAHYRDKLNFTWESLEAAQNALNNLRDEIRAWPFDFAQGKEDMSNGAWEGANLDANPFWQRFLEAASHDLGIPQALAVLWEMVHKNTPNEQSSSANERSSSANKSATILQMDKILGLELDKYLGQPLEIPEEVQKLIDQRENSRKSGDFKKSDDLRNKIKKLGYEIEDTKEGSKVKSGI